MSDRRTRKMPRRHPYEEAALEGEQRTEGGYYPRGYYVPYIDDEEEEWDDRPPRVSLISPFRVLLVLLVLIAGGVAFYGFLDRSALQLPLIIVGLALLGMGLLALSLSLARAAAQLGQQGSGGRALLAAFVGGLCILAAAGALSGAVVLGMLSV